MKLEDKIIKEIEELSDDYDIGYNWLNRPSDAGKYVSIKHKTLNFSITIKGALAFYSFGSRSYGYNPKGLVFNFWQRRKLFKTIAEQVRQGKTAEMVKERQKIEREFKLKDTKIGEII